MFPTEDFINRRTQYRFAGQSLSLDLSLGLFSSAGVDTGSMLLLKSVAQQVPLDELKTILDVGCGAGTLGLALASRCPQAQVTMVDRDTMAVDFTRHNARLNRLKNIHSTTRLMLEGPHKTPYNLILSNFPAKAGDPVLADYLGESMALLAPEGISGIVIVHTLAQRCKELIGEAQGEIIHEDSSKQHTVYLFRGKSQEDHPILSDSRRLTPYIRYSDVFKLNRSRYTLDTVWNISDFDTLSWRLKLAGDMIDSEKSRGTLAFWSPGQGHLPAATTSRFGARPQKVILAGRDTLSLAISRRNLEKQNGEWELETHSLADPMLLSSCIEEQELDLLVTDLDPVSRSEWTEPLKDTASQIVKPGGRWIILGRSADLASLLKHSRGWTPLGDKRTRGWRCAMLRRND